MAGETCERALGEVSLTNTYWKVLRLGETEVAPGEGRREPNLILREGEARFTATVGCNQVSGSYTLDEDRLTFGTAAATMMACPAPLDAWEMQLARGAEGDGELADRRADAGAARRRRRAAGAVSGGVPLLSALCTLCADWLSSLKYKNYLDRVRRKSMCVNAKMAPMSKRLSS